MEKIMVKKNIWSLLNWFKAKPLGSDQQIKVAEQASTTAVDAYWDNHTVNSTPFESVQKSLDYLEWRFEEYPLRRELTGLWGQHDGEIILDYGCGPANDLVGFLAHTQAQKVIGVDVSSKALRLAAHRLSLHHFSPARTELIRTSDDVQRIPLDDQSVDFIYCDGVLHHTSQPEAILQEFYRVLRSNKRTHIMVYNRNSLWFHHYTAYYKMILENAFPNLTVEEAFSKNTDGPECPIARAYRPDQWLGLCRQAGFDAEYLGGFFARWELDLFKEHGSSALTDDRLPQEQRDFLASLTYDNSGYPMYEGMYAGIGGVYRLWKRGNA
jgi:ubiquinone/menaquinone biosynthesis C-methylase UbiE